MSPGLFSLLFFSELLRKISFKSGTPHDKQTDCVRVIQGSSTSPCGQVWKKPLFGSMGDVTSMQFITSLPLVKFRLHIECVNVTVCLLYYSIVLVSFKSHSETCVK